MLVLKGLVGLHRPIQLQFFNATGGGIDLDYCNIEWFALETSRDHSVIFVIASKYCICTAMLYDPEEHLPVKLPQEVVNRLNELDGKPVKA